MMLDPKQFRERTRPSAQAMQLAKRLRAEMSPAEVRLWALLKNRKLANLRFRNQAPIGNYVADFYCPEARLVVEVDGQEHTQRRDHDERRDIWMTDCGIHVIRITPAQLAKEIDAVCRTISHHARERKQLLGSLKVSQQEKAD